MGNTVNGCVAAAHYRERTGVECSCAEDFTQPDELLDRWVWLHVALGHEVTLTISRTYSQEARS